MVPTDSLSYTFFEEIKQWVKRSHKLQRQRFQITSRSLAAESAWLRAEHQQLISCELDYKKVKALQKRPKKCDRC